jgi:hypothetical protein
MLYDIFFCLIYYKETKNIPTFAYVVVTVKVKMNYNETN